MKAILFIPIFFISILCSAQSWRKIYRDTKKTNEVKDKQAQILLEAANKGDLDSIYQMGVTSEKYAEKMHWFKKGEAVGNAKCIYGIGNLYFDGKVLKGGNIYQSYDSALVYFNRAKDMGNSEVLYKFGEMFQYGVKDWLKSSVENPNIANAIFWYKQAAEKGYAPAKEKVEIFNTAADNCFNKAMGAYEAKNYKEALRLWKIDAEINNNSKAVYNVGVIYSMGQGVPENDNEARKWFAKSGRMGYADGSFTYAETQNFLQEYETASEWFDLAIKQGYKGSDSSINKNKKDLALYKAKKAEDLANTGKRMLEAQRYSDAMNRQANKSYSNSTTVPKSVPANKTWCFDCKGTGKTHTQESYQTASDRKNQTNSWKTVSNNCGRCYGKGSY